MATLSWPEIVHKNKMWAQPRNKSPSNSRYNSADPPEHRSGFWTFNGNKKFEQKVYDHHVSPTALQEAAKKRKTRQPEDLPMKYSFAESRNHMASQSLQRFQNTTFVKSAEDSSVSLCRMGKRLFEDAVDRATSVGTPETSRTSDSLQIFPNLNCSFPGSMKTVPSYATGHKRQKHNGPTITGSPLYNKQDIELYTIRCESSMSSGSRAATAPELKNQAERITSAFQVKPSNVQPTKKPPEYILIPLDEETKTKY